MNLKLAATTFAIVCLMSNAYSGALSTEDISLKGNVQTQVTKSIADDDNNFSSGWIRANIGAQYKSESLDGLIMLRIFAPEFGEKLKDANGKTINHDKILADLYWVNYKWNLGSDLLNLKLGHWKTDWSQSTNFGTYVDKDLTKRGLWMRDYSHNAVELGWKHGLNQLNAMLAAKDGNANQGYFRIEDDMKFTFPLEIKAAYRANFIDVVQNTAYVTHRVAAYASYTIMPNLRLYGEYACLYTEDENLDKKADNYIAPESKYFTPGDVYNPFYLGVELPTFGILSALMVEWEYINDREDLYTGNDKIDDWAWTVALVKSIGKSKLQFSIYSENEMTDVGLAFRLTTTIK